MTHPMIVPHGTTELRSAVLLSSDAMLEHAYTWLCGQRIERGHNNSIWDLRYNWSDLKPQLQQQLRTGAYRLSPMQSYCINNEWISSWTALDSLVLKALTLTLQPIFSIETYPHCTHLKDAGGLHAFQRGIPKGCPLSPLMAALYLKPLDDEMFKHGFYVRFMDDWIIMVKTKHQLRKVIQLTYKILNKLKLKMHPDKTFLGCIKKGFDFLGVHFGDTPRISNTSLENHRVKLARRYAQGASTACIGDYVARWTSWCAGVLKCCSGQLDVINSMGQEASRQIGHMVLPKENNHEEILDVLWMEKVQCN